MPALFPPHDCPTGVGENLWMAEGRGRAAV